jgi:hypothetical protein
MMQMFRASATANPIGTVVSMNWMYSPCDQFVGMLCPYLANIHSERTSPVIGTASMTLREIGESAMYQLLCLGMTFTFFT